MAIQHLDINWLLAFPVTAIIAGLVVAAIQQRGLLPATTARILLAVAWLVAVVSAGAFLLDGAPMQHRILVGFGFVGLPFGLALVILELLLSRAVRQIDKAKAEQSRLDALPKFNISPLDITTLAPYASVYLDKNVFRTGVNNRKRYLTTIGIVFENRAINADDARVDNISAKVIIRTAGIGMEQSRIPTACWINEPTPDVDFPLDTPKALYLGGWEIRDKDFASDRIKLFKFDRVLNKPVGDVTSFAGFPHNLLLEVTLTPKGFPGAAQTFHFSLQIVGVGFFKLFPIPSTS